MTRLRQVSLLKRRDFLFMLEPLTPPPLCIIPLVGRNRPRGGLLADPDPIASGLRLNEDWPLQVTVRRGSGIRFFEVASAEPALLVGFFASSLRVFEVTSLLQTFPFGAPAWLTCHCKDSLGSDPAPTETGLGLYSFQQSRPCQGRGISLWLYLKARR